MQRAVTQAHGYPQRRVDDLTERIAAWCQVTSDRVAIGSGSVGRGLARHTTVDAADEALEHALILTPAGRVTNLSGRHT
ncbi:hypothetical protein [Streptomyces sioyaensis]|uniref:hypothetical protein n=1 Tax=Streptomyces sioyaensis TaxID=67364 RepID=UPI0037AB7AED